MRTRSPSPASCCSAGASPTCSAVAACSAAATRRFDFAGALSVTLGLVAIVFAVVRTEVNGWGSAQTLGVLGAGLALIALFLVIEGRFAARPLMPLRIFRSRPLSGANAV